MLRYSENNKLSEDIEKEFRIKFGAYPDRYYFDRLKDGLSSSDAAALVSQRIDEVWKEMQFNYNRKKATA